MTTATIIIAKTNGTCSKCGGKITAGDEIKWSQGCGTQHIVCGAARDNATTSHEFYRSGYQKSDCNIAVGKILTGKRGYLIVIEADEPIDTDEGQKPWSQRYVCRPCTSDERAAADTATRIAQLRRQLDALAAPADDDRDYDRITADRAKVIAELAAIDK